MFHTHFFHPSLYVPVDADAEHAVLAGGLGKEVAEQLTILDYPSAKKK